MTDSNGPENLSELEDLKNIESTSNIRDNVSTLFNGNLSFNYEPFVKDLSEQEKKSLSFEMEKLLVNAINKNDTAKKSLNKFVELKTENQDFHEIIVFYWFYSDEKGSWAASLISMNASGNTNIQTIINFCKKRHNLRNDQTLNITDIKLLCNCKYHFTNDGKKDNVYVIYYRNKDNYDNILTFNYFVKIDKEMTSSYIVEFEKQIQKEFGTTKYNPHISGYCNLSRLL
jgi:hypothetical protein